MMYQTGNRIEDRFHIFSNDVQIKLFRLDFI